MGDSGTEGGGTDIDDVDEQLGSVMSQRFGGDEGDEDDSGEPEVDTEPANDPEPAEQEVEHEPEGDEEEEDDGGPAFSYEEATTQSVYPRPGTWRRFKALRNDVESQLIREDGLEELRTREIDDAALRALEGRKREIVEKVRTAREADR